ncbi:phosphoenolpyruvate--protein phosphotransferase [bacterium]
MKVLKGTSLFPGLVKGIGCVYSNEQDGAIPHYSIPEKQLPNEIKKLDNALYKTMEFLNTGIERVSEPKAKQILNVHRLILDDKGLKDKLYKTIRKRKINAEHAVNDVFEEYIDIYDKKYGRIQELTHDLVYLRERILNAFSGIAGRFECPAIEDKPIIVVSQKLTPYMVFTIPKEKVLAFVTKEGGYTTHAMILARSLSVPIISGIDVSSDIKCSDKLLVDGFLGTVTVSPDKKTETKFLIKMKSHLKKADFCNIRKHISAKTKNNIRLKLSVNISRPKELELIKDFNYDSVGLLRTEFLFLNRVIPPTEEEQFNMYKSIAQESLGKTITIRLLDIGSDKLPSFFILPRQVNPDMEIKGARAVEVFYDVYLTQAKAILRASMFGNFRLLYPMISDFSDIETYKNLINDAKKSLRKEKIKFADRIKQGIMVETPAAALLADEFLKDIDYVNIGSNDLLQYTLAASRGNPVIENRYHILHPSILKLIEVVVKAGKKHNKEICLCGEVAAFEKFYPALLKLGIRSFSVAASKFSYLKCELMNMRYNAKTDILNKIYSARSKGELDKIFD